jgi:hypothetical protein
MRDIKEIKSDIETARAEYQSKANSLPVAELRPLTQKVKELQSELAATISDGAEACNACENHPHGMEQQVAIKGQAMPIYEVGCLVCPDRRAQGFTPEGAVKAWNDEKFLPPKKEAA